MIAQRGRSGGMFPKNLTKLNIFRCGEKGLAEVGGELESATSCRAGGQQLANRRWYALLGLLSHNRDVDRRNGARLEICLTTGR
ncbi:MAG: hypothetical protein MUC60_14950 [Oscillatoria sp. Prado101]|nr:hypothetical protein [Oscillatoria sp. Prado101]